METKDFNTVKQELIDLKQIVDGLTTTITSDGLTWLLGKLGDIENIILSQTKISRNQITELQGLYSDFSSSVTATTYITSGNKTSISAIDITAALATQLQNSIDMAEINMKGIIACVQPQNERTVKPFILSSFFELYFEATGTVVDLRVLKETDERSVYFEKLNYNFEAILDPSHNNPKLAIYLNPQVEREAFVYALKKNMEEILALV
jgi:hypothetical protein